LRGEGAVLTVAVNRRGKRSVGFRADPDLSGGLNDRAARNLPIRNQGRTGLDNAGYKALWDAEHPEDPLELP
jgi:hypothetical protein